MGPFTGSHPNENRINFVLGDVEATRLRTLGQLWWLSAFAAFATVVIVALVLKLAGRTHVPPSSNQYFQAGDPMPLPFPAINAKTTFAGLSEHPSGGEPFEVGLQWQPASGPFISVKAGPPERGHGLWVQYQVRPAFLAPFRLGLAKALSGQANESGPHAGDFTFPDIRGYRVTLEGGTYTLAPLDPDDIGADAFVEGFKEFLVAVAAVCMLQPIIFVILRRRLHPSVKPSPGQ